GARPECEHVARRRERRLPRVSIARANPTGLTRARELAGVGDRVDAVVEALVHGGVASDEAEPRTNRDVTRAVRGEVDLRRDTGSGPRQRPGIVAVRAAHVLGVTV